MTIETIDREAGDSSKGFRLQLLRAIALVLKTLKQDSKTVFYIAVENVGDVTLQTFEKDEVKQYLEEDKNYDLESNFTIFSRPILNTLASFFDTYSNQFGRSDSLVFGFYTTRNIGKERKRKLSCGKVVSLPELPVLELLKDMSTVEDAVVELVQSALIEEYNSQYENHSGEGHKAALCEMSNSEFRKFLEKINWFFGQADEVELKKIILKEIELSPFYNSAHIGKVESIFSILMEKLSEFQANDDLVSKSLHSAEVKLIFKEAESLVSDVVLDPVWRELNCIDVNDKRNLQEKVSSVVEDLTDRRIRILARKASASKAEEINSDKTFLSLKYRVLTACDEFMDDSQYEVPLNMNDLDSVTSGLLLKALSDINELKSDYTYSISNEKTIEGIIWNLFDECFLAFEEHKA